MSERLLHALVETLVHWGTHAWRVVRSPWGLVYLALMVATIVVLTLPR